MDNRIQSLRIIARFFVKIRLLCAAPWGERVRCCPGTEDIMHIISGVYKGHVPSGPRPFSVEGGDPNGRYPDCVFFLERPFGGAGKEIIPGGSAK